MCCWSSISTSRQRKLPRLGRGKLSGEANGELTRSRKTRSLTHHISAAVALEGFGRALRAKGDALMVSSRGATEKHHGMEIQLATDEQKKKSRRFLTGSRTEQSVRLCAA
jgi:hypothetical protein